MVEKQQQVKKQQQLNLWDETAVSVQVTESARIGTASAIMRQGVIHVKVPRQWGRDYKGAIIQELVHRVMKKVAAERKLVETLEDQSPKITVAGAEALTAFVKQVNTETFNVPLGKIQIGWAKYSRLAQVNLRTRTMTVSKYCLSNVPESALRYLIIHELAHFLEAGHTKRFWGLVGQFVPDYRKQSRLMKAYHRRAVLQEHRES